MVEVPLAELQAAWKRCGCVIVGLPSGGGVVVAPKKGVIFELNADAYMLMQRVIADNFVPSELSARTQSSVFFAEVLKIIQ
jgi:hypothetical protein